MSNFNAVDHFEGTGAFGTGVAAFRIAEVKGFGDWEMQPGNNASEVGIFFVGADDGGSDQCGVMVNKKWAFEADRSGKTDGGAGDLQDSGFVCKFD